MIRRCKRCLLPFTIIAQQEFGIYGDWKAKHGDLCIGRGPHGMYFAFAGSSLLSQSDRLETVISDFAEKHPYETLDDQWKVSRWEVYQS